MLDHALIRLQRIAPNTWVLYQSVPSPVKSTVVIEDHLLTLTDADVAQVLADYQTAQHLATMTATTVDAAPVATRDPAPVVAGF